MLVIAID